MRIEAPWSCGGCEHANAGYRRRCEACGQRRPPDAATTADGGDVVVADGPAARERGGRWAWVVVTALVLVAALIGAVDYFTNRPPSATDDLEALEAAVPSPAAIGPGYRVFSRDARTSSPRLGLLQPFESLPDVDGVRHQDEDGPCGLDLATREEEAVTSGVVAQVQHVFFRTETELPLPVVLLVSSFETPIGADGFRAVHASAEVRACRRSDMEHAVAVAGGRVAVVLVAAEEALSREQLDALAGQVLDRVEIEG